MTRGSVCTETDTGQGFSEYSFDNYVGVALDQSHGPRKCDCGAP